MHSVFSHTSASIIGIVNRERVVTFSDNEKSACWTRHPEINRPRCKPDQFPCTNPNCQSVFTWKQNLTRHLRYQCGQLPRFKCPYCYYVCKVKADVLKHIRAKHKNYAVYVIDIFQQSEALQWILFKIAIFNKDIIRGI